MKRTGIKVDKKVGNLAVIDQPAGAPVKVGVGYRGGFAIWTEASIVSMTNGLSTVYGAAMVGGIGIVHSGDPGTLSFCMDLQSCIGGNLPATGTLVEFRNSILDHYFITLEGSEARAIDAGAAGPGWSRTGHTFEVYADIQATPYTVNPACRFHGTPGVGPNSHFYSIYPGECKLTQQDKGWTIESSDAFGAMQLGQVKDATSGKFVFGCPYSRTVYRLYNNRSASNDSNHRYVNDVDVYKAMQAAGWVGEGPAFCERPVNP